MIRTSRQLAFVGLAAGIVVVMTAGVAGAQDDTSTPIAGVPTLTALIVLGAGFLIRPVTAFLTTQAADSGFLGGLAGIGLAALTAGGAALADVDDIGDDWKSIVAVTLTTALTAFLATGQIWGGKAVDWIHAKTDGMLGGAKASATTPAPKRS